MLWETRFQVNNDPIVNIIARDKIAAFTDSPQRNLNVRLCNPKQSRTPNTSKSNSLRTAYRFVPIIFTNFSLSH
jgi:hypothetical protein